MKSITIPYVSDREKLFGPDVPNIPVTTVLWPENDYFADVQARLCYGDDALFVGFTVYENSVQCIHLEPNAPVSQDSCVEFFFQPDPEHDAYYFNFEMNAIGTFLVKKTLRRGVTEFVRRTDDREFAICTTLDAQSAQAFSGPFWQVSYQIPYSLITEYFSGAHPGPGWRMRANFYKCGGKTPKPHHQSWNKIDVARPEFHLSSYFGEVLFGPKE